VAEFGLEFDTHAGRAGSRSDENGRRPLDRLRAIKRLVDDAGINLAGIQRLLSIAAVVQRIRPLMRDEPLSAREARRLSQEIDELAKMLGLD
jgi:hypothetical protein